MSTESRDPWRPAFRGLEAHRIDDGERPGLVLIDPLGLVEGQVFVPEAVLPIVGLIDGQRTVEEIVDELERAGVPTPAGFVADVVRQLDEGLLLQGELFENTLARTIEDFSHQTSRRASHAGSHGYPADPDACRAALDAVVGPVGPSHDPGPTPAGLVAPHIDLGRGQSGYGATYGRLAECEPADLYVVLGTGHHGPSAPLTGLAMDWETPLGIARTDREFVARVHERIGDPRRLDLWLHAKEHSIEFQILFLTHLAQRAERDVEVAGFLCGPLPSTRGDPDEEAYVQRLTDALRDAAERSGKRVCWVAGADLAHVGPFFGDPAPIDADRLERLLRDDRSRLDSLERGAPGAFHAAVVGAGNPDRVCSATAIYLAARLAGGTAQLLHYEQATADDGSQAVSFCSAVLGEP